jgi:hypothetical protein
MNDFLHATLGYIENGFFVFPLHPKSMTPLMPNGYKDASNDPTIFVLRTPVSILEHRHG